MTETRETLTTAQRWILERLETGASVRPAGGYEIHHSFCGTPTWYGAPHASFASCVRRGFIESGVITAAGRAVLLPTPPQGGEAPTLTPELSHD